jgi:type IV secretion system protein VirD4
VGVTPLTKQEWLLHCLMAVLSASIGAFVWHVAFLLLSPHVPSLILLVSIAGLNLLLVCVLLWLRLQLAHLSWLKLWTLAAPVALASSMIFPPHLVIVIPLAWTITLLFAFWGYYRCFYPFVGLETSLHKARFARRHELADLYGHSADHTSLILGVNHWYAFLRRFVLVRPTRTRKALGNLLVVAPTQIGKSLLATAQLLSWKQSVIVNDIKGELFQATAGYRSTLGKVFVIDPTGIGNCYDPLEGKDTEDKLFSAAAAILFEPEERERIFTQRATVMLTQLFAAARKEGKPALPYVRQMTRQGLEYSAKRLQTLSPELATQLLDVRYEEAHFSDRFLHSAWSTLTTKLRPLLTETVIRCFTCSDFTPESILRSQETITVYFRWPEKDLLALSPLVRLLWGSLIDEFIAIYDKKQGSGCKPVLLLIDEAGRTAIPSLADHATTVVGRGISLWIAIQSISQLETIYGKARAQVLKDNMETQIYHRTNDFFTAKYLEDRLGSKSGYARSVTSREGRYGGSSSEGQAERPIPLLTAQEMMKLRDQEILGFHRNLPPFKIRRVEWWRHPILRQRRNIPAPALLPLPALVDFLPKETPGGSDGDEDVYYLTSLR